MDIASVRHRGLRHLLERDDPRGLPPDLVRRIRRVLAALVVADDVASVLSLPGWRLHRLVGDREGTYSISVSGNWRITFKIDGDAIRELDLEDYH